ncbi:ADP-heptose--LPS heptosyltransferase [Flavobacterium sediminis]|uniref:ADP-heptose--LPS heptosyltransferase n=1 Tax=Flavobacterium sediminis TaxID=2201181 RepID=A0A2U8QWB7_9FLAO|nr:glycosyltransferase family 9 protein [Flavobacterium sediminis]AWM14497.1 ADP-heptose--LPS heptosyltransferase [Flavobacterium sediminis]
MSNLAKINIFRRKITKGLTRNIGKNRFIVKGVTPKKILIVRPNHRLGNTLLITPLILEISKQFPDSKIDLFVKGTVANVLFENYTQVDQILCLPKKHFKELFLYFKTWFRLRLKKYDLVINTTKGSSSGRLATKLSRAPYKFYGEIEDNPYNKLPDYEHFAKFPVYNFWAYLELSGRAIPEKNIPVLSLKLSAEELQNGQEKLHEIIPDKNKPTIAIFTFATGDKCYSEQWWEKLYQAMLAEFKDYNLIEILPVENISQIQHKAPTYYSKDIREITAVMANTSIFIGADSGMMHLSVSSGTTTIGLFHVTDPTRYGPYGNKNCSLNTTGLSTEEIIKEIKDRL